MGKARRILLSSFLLVSCIVVKRLLAIRLPFMSIGFDFIPFMFSAMLLGTKYTTVIGITSDIIGRLLFPMSGYFPGFTLSAGLTGFLYGKFLYKDGEIKADKKFLIRLIFCVITVTSVVNIVLNTIWISEMIHKAACLIIPVRIVKSIVMVPIQVFVVYYFAREVEKGTVFSCKLNRDRLVVSTNRI